jgi:hypothetical protein
MLSFAMSGEVGQQSSEHLGWDAMQPVTGREREREGRRAGKAMDGPRSISREYWNRNTVASRLYWTAQYCTVL